jgi:peroxin-3
MEQVRDLEAFAAVVYSSNWESEISPISNEASMMPAQKRSLEDPEIIAAELKPSREEPPSHEGIVDVGTASTFECA